VQKATLKNDFRTNFSRDLQDFFENNQYDAGSALRCCIRAQNSLYNRENAWES